MTSPANYILPSGNLDQRRIMQNWLWLIGNDKSIVWLTKTGDLLLTNEVDRLYFLDCGSGRMDLIVGELDGKGIDTLSELQIDEILLPSVVDRLEEEGMILPEGKVYSYTLLPILGGEYSFGNRYPLDIYEHYQLTGDLHFQMKDLQDGTAVKIEIVD